MSISEDAGKLLLALYKEKINTGKLLKIKELYLLTNWDDVIRFENAYKYCINKNYILVDKFLGSGEYGLPNVYIEDLTTYAIDLIENARKSEDGNTQFNINFNFYTKINVDSIVKAEAKLF